MSRFAERTEETVARAAVPAAAGAAPVFAPGAGLAGAGGNGAGAELPGAGGATPIIVCFRAERAAAEGLGLAAGVALAPAPIGLGAAAIGLLPSVLTETLFGDAAGAREACAGLFALAPADPVPSTTIAAPQRLHVMRTFRPRTLSSGTAYFAGQLPHWTFISDLR
jgi:hypothetical protein